MIYSNKLLFFIYIRSSCLRHHHTSSSYVSDHLTFLCHLLGQLVLGFFYRLTISYCSWGSFFFSYCSKTIEGIVLFYWIGSPTIWDVWWWRMMMTYAARSDIYKQQPQELQSFGELHSYGDLKHYQECWFLIQRH